MLINGAGRRDRAFALQLAAAAGIHVTGVDNAGKLDFMRSLGADEVIDYRRDDFTHGTGPYDLIVDLVARRSVFAYRRALAPGGTLPDRRRDGARRCCGCSRSALIGRSTHGRRVGCSRCSRGRRSSSRSPHSASRTVSGSTSTACSLWTRCPRRSRTSARAAPSARSWWRSTSTELTPRWDYPALGLGRTVARRSGACARLRAGRFDRGASDRWDGLHHHPTAGLTDVLSHIMASETPRRIQAATHGVRGTSPWHIWQLRRGAPRLGHGTAARRTRLERVGMPRNKNTSK